MIQTEHQIIKAEIMCIVQKHLFSLKRPHSYYSSSKYEFIAAIICFVFFVLYEEKLAWLFLYNIK